VGAAQRAGFQRDDILIAINGQTDRLTESELLAQILTQSKPGDRLNNIDILRGSRRMTIALPTQ
jgi:predicted metalloprotease with PDZ domain